jgi:hypothetical protein
VQLSLGDREPRKQSLSSALTGARLVALRLRLRPTLDARLRLGHGILPRSSVTSFRGSNLRQEPRARFGENTQPAPPAA